MKRILLTITLIAATTALMAPSHGPRPHHPDKGADGPKIEELVSDLTAAQKTRIDLITRKTQKNVEAIHARLDAVRDSIRSYMNSRDDHSDILFPLFDREANLQAELSKEIYRSKAAIDKVLTPEQFKKLHERMEANKPKHDHKKPNGKGRPVAKDKTANRS